MLAIIVLGCIAAILFTDRVVIFRRRPAKAEPNRVQSFTFPATEHVSEAGYRLVSLVEIEPVVVFD